MSKKQPEPKFLLGINRDRLGGDMDPEEYEKKRRQARQFGILRSALMLVGLVVLAVLFARGNAGPKVEVVTTARGLDSQMEPSGITDTFEADDVVYVSVEILAYEESMDVVARVRYEGEIAAEVAVDESMVSERYIGWVLNPDEVGLDEWAVGDYTVEVIYEGRQSLGSTTFGVVP